MAFDKLFRRVRERKDNATLIALITRRLDATDDAQEIQKLYWEHARASREMGDTAGALKALEHVMMLDSDHVGALALLGEINIRRGEFEAAAKSLARLATLDTAPARSRVTAGVAAVDLYENKLDRSDKALEVLLALQRPELSTLPVRERLARAAARTGAWNEATAILEELMFERPEVQGRIEAARLAIAIHRDRLNHPQGAAAAIAKLLEENPTDGEALDILLATDHPREIRTRLLRNARAGLVEALRSRPTDVTEVTRLAKVARALGDDALEQATLGVLSSLSAADVQGEHAFALLAGRKPRIPQIAIGPSMLRNILAEGDEGPVADLFVLLAGTLAEGLGPNLQACGVSRRDKVDPRSGIALRNEIAAWAGAFGMSEFDLYVGGTDPHGVQGIAGDPPAIVVGSGVNAPLGPMTRARIARELLGIVRGTTITRSRDDVTIAAIVVAACRLAEVPIEHPPYAVLAEVERLQWGRPIARKNSQVSRRRLQHHRPNPRERPRLEQARSSRSHDRVATIASGDPSHRTPATFSAAPQAEKLGALDEGEPPCRRAAAFRPCRPSAHRDPSSSRPRRSIMTDEKKPSSQRARSTGTKPFRNGRTTPSFLKWQRTSPPTSQAPSPGSPLPGRSIDLPSLHRRLALPQAGAPSTTTNLTTGTTLAYPRASLYDEEAGSETRIATVSPELLASDESERKAPSRGGLGQLFAREDRRDPEHRRVVRRAAQQAGAGQAGSASKQRITATARPKRRRAARVDANDAARRRRTPGSPHPGHDVARRSVNRQRVDRPAGSRIGLGPSPLCPEHPYRCRIRGRGLRS